MGALAGQDTAQNQNQNQTSSTTFRPEDVNRLNDVFGQLSGGVSGQNKYLSNAAGQPEPLNYGFNTNANVNTNFQAPQLSTSLDPNGQAAYSKLIGENRGASETNKTGISTAFRNNPALAKILNSQIDSQTQLNNNPLFSQALGIQNQTAMTQAGANNQAIQASNEAKIAGGNFQNSGVGAYNQTVGQGVGFGQQGLSNSNALMQALQSLAAGFGTNNTTGVNAGTNQSGGLLGKIGARVGWTSPGQ